MLDLPVGELEQRMAGVRRLHRRGLRTGRDRAQEAADGAPAVVAVARTVEEALLEDRGVGPVPLVAGVVIVLRRHTPNVRRRVGCAQGSRHPWISLISEGRWKIPGWVRGCGQVRTCGRWKIPRPRRARSTPRAPFRPSSGATRHAPGRHRENAADRRGGRGEGSGRARGGRGRGLGGRLPRSWKIPGSVVENAVRPQDLERRAERACDRGPGCPPRSPTDAARRCDRSPRTRTAARDACARSTRPRGARA
jgi:hypothetical protein